MIDHAALARPHDPADYVVPELMVPAPATGDMLWRYGARTNRLRRLTEPPLDHPATRAAAEAASPSEPTQETNR